MAANGENSPSDPHLSGASNGSGDLLSMTIWPHRSLSPGGFRLVMIGTAIALAVPLAGIVGAKALWIVALFAALDLALLWGALRLTYRSGRVREHLDLWRDRLRVERVDPNGGRRVWEANPQWVRIEIVETRRVPSYLVLTESGRSVELGAFLAPSERRALAAELRGAIARARGAR